jgi:hypothetical protein
VLTIPHTSGKIKSAIKLIIRKEIQNTLRCIKNSASFLYYDTSEKLSDEMIRQN